LSKLVFIKYLIKRILIALTLIFGILTVTFILTRYLKIPSTIFSPHTNWGPKEYLHYIGFDLPLHIQYLKFLIDIFSGNWGISVSYERNNLVTNVIAESLRLTMDLVFFSLILALILGTIIGFRSSIYRNKLRDTLSRLPSEIGPMIPIIFLGFFLKYILSTPDKILIFDDFSPILDQKPPYLIGSLLIDSLLSGQFMFTLQYLIQIALPVLTLSTISYFSFFQTSKNSMTNVLTQDYIKTAKAKGLNKKQVFRRHILRNSIVSCFSNLRFNLNYLLSGSFFVEIIFYIPGLRGLGRVFLFALHQYDYYLIIGIIVVYTLIVAIFKLIIDIISVFLNPVRLHQKEEKFFNTVRENERMFC
jgi:ABC-type dipeptide/oligopeptide/nickel transport system permease component